MEVLVVARHILVLEMRTTVSSLPHGQVNIPDPPSTSRAVVGNTTDPSLIMKWSEGPNLI